MSHRHHHTLNESGLAVTPNSSIPGTPLVGCQDYAVVPNTDEMVCCAAINVCCLLHSYVNNRVNCTNVVTFIWRCWYVLKEK
jgi:hypothetical protein